MAAAIPTASPNTVKGSQQSKDTRKDRAEQIVELEFAGYVLEKAKALGGTKATWERVTKQQLSLDNDKVAELSRKYRKLDGVGPLTAFSDLSTTQQRVINRIIAQAQSSEKNGSAEWALECIGRDGPRDWRNRLKICQKITVVIRRQAKTGLQTRYPVREDEQIDLNEPLPAKHKGKAKKTAKSEEPLANNPQYGSATVPLHPSYGTPPSPTGTGFPLASAQYGHITAPFQPPSYLEPRSDGNMQNPFASPSLYGEAFFPPPPSFQARYPSARHIVAEPHSTFGDQARNEPEHLIEKSFARLRFRDDSSEQSDYLDRMDRDRLWDNGSQRESARPSLATSSPSSPAYSSQDSYIVSIDHVSQRGSRGSSDWETFRKPKYRGEYGEDFPRARRRDYDRRVHRRHVRRDGYDSIDDVWDPVFEFYATGRRGRREARREESGRRPSAVRNRSSSRQYNDNDYDDPPGLRRAPLDSLADQREEDRRRTREKQIHDQELHGRDRAEGHQIANRPLSKVREDSPEPVRKIGESSQVAKEATNRVPKHAQNCSVFRTSCTRDTNNNAHSRPLPPGLEPDGSHNDHGESHIGQRHQSCDESKHHEMLGAKASPGVSNSPNSACNAVNVETEQRSYERSYPTAKISEPEQDDTKTLETRQPSVRDRGTNERQSESSTQDSAELGRDDPASFDTLRDLERRTQRLLILTKPDTPHTSEGSATGETASLSSFGSPIHSPGVYQCAAGGQGTHDRPSRPTSGLQGIDNIPGHFNPRDDQSDGGGSGDEGDSSRRRAKPRSSGSGSSGSKRYPCVYRIGDPQRFDTHTMCWEYVSQMLRHLESHDLFMCSKCLTTFGSKEQKVLHDKMRACVKTCTSRACKRHTMDFSAPNSTCRCLLSSDDVWAAIFRQIFPHQPLPAPWRSKVQQWLIDPAGNLQQQDAWLQNSEQSQQPSHFGTLPESFPLQDVLNLHAIGDMTNGVNHSLAPNFQLGNMTATASGFENSYSQGSAGLRYASQAPAAFALPDIDAPPMQTVSHADLQKLRQQLAVLEQRVERPRRSEQKESAMLRLAWKRLVEIGDQSVQEGGLLRQVAEHLAPELIGESTPELNGVMSAQAIDATNTMDWDAAGLGPQHLPAPSKGKQRAVSGATDSAYFSGMHMG